MSLDTVVAAIKVAAPTASPGGIALSPTFSPSEPAFAAEWRTARAANFIAYGDTEEEAFDNLLLVLEGRQSEVERRIRLRKALADEQRLQAEYSAAVAEREAIEAERLAQQATRA